MNKYIKGDRVIWAIIFLLSIFSILSVYSAIGTLAYKYQDGNTTVYFVKHLFFVLLGLAIIFVFHNINYNVYFRISKILIVVIIPLLLITLLFGKSMNEASRWLAVPIIDMSFQTSDLAKIVLIMYVAQALSTKKDNIKDFYNTFVPIMFFIIIVCSLIFVYNFSTAFLLFTTSIILLFIGRINLKHLFYLALAFILIFSLFIFGARKMELKGRVGTWQNRIENFMNKDVENNYQVEQSKIAIASGGYIGKGPGNSEQKYYLPHPYSDFIFSIIVEEYGLIAGLIIIAAYFFLLFRAGYIVRQVKGTFAAFLCIGLIILIVLQAFTNIAVAVNLVPVTGQPLPLVSMGGSSIIFTSVAFGIILSISRQVEKEKENERNKIKE